MKKRPGRPSRKKERIAIGLRIINDIEQEQIEDARFKREQGKRRREIQKKRAAFEKAQEEFEGNRSLKALAARNAAQQDMAKLLNRRRRVLTLKPKRIYRRLTDILKRAAKRDGISPRKAKTCLDEARARVKRLRRDLPLPK